MIRYVHTEGTLAERAEEWRVRVLPDGRPLDVRRIVPDSAPGDSPAPDSARRIARRALAAAGVDTLHLREADFVETQRPRRRDATVTWIDTTISLPAGASARAWVSLAGSDVLVTRRGIELPEAFQRADRDRQTRMLAVSALFGSLLFGGLIAGIVFVARRRVALTTDRTFDRSTGRALVALLAVTAIVGSFSTWPASLFSYDTSTPWSTHVTQAAVTSAFIIVGALLVAALWMVFEMLRTRTGIAAWPDAAARSDTHDALTAGVGLGAVYMAGSLIRNVAAPRTVAGPPTTSLNDLLPFMDGALAVPSDVALMVAFMAIPLLMILAISPVSRTRWLFIALFLVLGGAAIVPAGMSASASGIDVTKAAVALASGLAFAFALYGWAPRGAYSWIAAALTASALTQLREAVHEPTGVEQVSGMVGAAVAVVALLWLRRRSGRTDRVAQQS